ncbi:hypothetical protein K0A96_00915 [Patescibacteria group bacterium]|nr:hypothetical protein [Patescibacteria group bacterium]
MKSNVRCILLILFLVIISALFVFSILKTVAPIVRKEHLILTEKYRESNQPSYLWQLILINPDENNINQALDELIASGDIAGAKLLNFWLRDPKFNLKVVENSIINQREYTHLGYYETLDFTKKEEISYFLNLKDGNLTKPNFNQPITSLGKIATMIYKDDFDLYIVENTLGAEIKKQADTHQNTTEQRVSIANVFQNYGFPKIALVINNTTTKENPCLYQSLDLEIEIYEEINQPDEIIRSIDNLLYCYPDNQLALEKAINVTKKHGLDPDNYQTRLKELNKINK